MPDLRLASPFQDEEGGGLGGTTTAPEPTVTAPPTPAKFNWDEAMAAQKKAPPEAKFMAAEDFDLAAARMERQKRAEEASKVEVERGLPGEIGASLVRGALGMAKLVPQAAKFVAGDVLGSKTAKAVGEDVIGKMEEWAQSPELKPSTSAGPPIDLDRILSSPGEVVGQIASQVANPHFWAAQLPEGAVSMVPFFIGTYAPRAIALAGNLGKTLTAAQEGLKVAEAAAAAGDAAAAAKIVDYTKKIADASKKLERIGTIGGYGAAFAMEAGQGEDNVRQYEQQHPDKPIPWANKILAVIGTGVVAGSLEAASLGRIFMGKYAGDEAIAKLTGAALEKGAGAIGKVAAGEMGAKVAADTIIKDIFSGRNGGNYLARKILDSVMVEGLTEGAQSIVENAAARLGYDVDQKFTEGVVESMLVGAALGGLGGGYEGFRHRQHAVQAVWDRVHEAKKAADFEYYQNASLSMAASNEAKARAAAYSQMQGWQDVPPDQWPAPVHPTVQPTQAPDNLTQEQKDLYDALATPPWARDARKKLIADNYEKDFQNALRQASNVEVPEPGFDYIPQVAPVPAAFGGPRPPWLANTRAEEARTLPSPIAPTGYEPGEIARTGAAPSLPEEIVHLTNLVDQTGDPTAAKRLTDLIMANKDSVGALFEPRGREDLRPIAEHLNNLFTKVDEGDPNAARELHEFLSSNIDLLRGATRLEIAVATPPAPIVEVTGTGPDATITSPPGASPAPPEGAPPGAPPPGTPPPCRSRPSGRHAPPRGSPRAALD